MALSHLNAKGEARMVDVSAKAETERLAVATAFLRMKPETAAQLGKGGLPKGDALAVARVAAVQAAKRTSELIPLCHPLRLTGIVLAFEVRESGVAIRAEVRARDRTGVEMEALTAAAVAALTLYDMAKSEDKGMVIEEVALEEKRGGKSGDWKRD